MYKLSLTSLNERIVKSFQILYLNCSIKEDNILFNLQSTKPGVHFNELKISPAKRIAVTI